MQKNTDRGFIFDMIREIHFEDISVGRQNLDHGFGKSLHVPLPDLRILAFQLLEDFKALRQLCEHVHHGVGEVGVFRVLLELKV